MSSFRQKFYIHARSTRPSAGAPIDPAALIPPLFGGETPARTWNRPERFVRLKGIKVLKRKGLGDPQAHPEGTSRTPTSRCRPEDGT